MLSKIAVSFQGLSGKERDREILRIAVMSEMDSVDFYDQLASEADDHKIKEVIYGIVKEEKDHLKKFKNLIKK